MINQKELKEAVLREAEKSKGKALEHIENILQMGVKVFIREEVKDKKTEEKIIRFSSWLLALFKGSLEKGIAKDKQAIEDMPENTVDIEDTKDNLWRPKKKLCQKQ